MNLDKPGLSLQFVMKPKTRGVSPGLGLLIDISHGSSIYYDYNNNTFIQSWKYHTTLQSEKVQTALLPVRADWLNDVLRHGCTLTWSRTGCLKKNTLSSGLSQAKKNQFTLKHLTSE